MASQHTRFNDEERSKRFNKTLLQKDYRVIYKKWKWYMRNCHLKPLISPVGKQGRECDLTLEELQTEPLLGYFVHVEGDSLVGAERQCKFLKWVDKGCPNRKGEPGKCPHIYKDSTVRYQLGRCILVLATVCTFA